MRSARMAKDYAERATWVVKEAEQAFGARNYVTAPPCEPYTHVPHCGRALLESAPRTLLDRPTFELRIGRLHRAA
jgi:pyrimidine deaminase RibD-like protein